MRSSNYRYYRRFKNKSLSELNAIPIGGHRLPPLPYKYNQLRPTIDAQTMEIHYDKLHRGYVERLNKAELALKEMRNTNDYNLIKFWEGQLAFNGAGHYLHTLWWKSITPNKTVIREPLASEINVAFGSAEKFKEQFIEAAKKVEGPGWAMLVWAPRAWRIEILQVEKHQNGTQQDCIPLLVLDVWEHAYFLKYLNKRADYIEMCWDIINWETANYRLTQVKKIRWRPY